MKLVISQDNKFVRCHKGKNFSCAITSRSVANTKGLLQELSKKPKKNKKIKQEIHLQQKKKIHLFQNTLPQMICNGLIVQSTFQNKCRSFFLGAVSKNPANDLFEKFLII